MTSAEYATLPKTPQGPQPRVFYDGRDMVVATSPEQALALAVDYFGAEDSADSGPFRVLRDDFLVLTTVDSVGKPEVHGRACRRLGPGCWLVARTAAAVACEERGVVESLLDSGLLELIED